LNGRGLEELIDLTTFSAARGIQVLLSATLPQVHRLGEPPDHLLSNLRVGPQRASAKVHADPTRLLWTRRGRLVRVSPLGCRRGHHLYLTTYLRATVGCILSGRCSAPETLSRPAGTGRAGTRAGPPLL